MRPMSRARLTPQFNEALARLNAEQRAAVTHIEGPVMVIAGPGTGKTQILTVRIANILKEIDAEPSALLALTFTEAGVSAMRRRLVTLIGADAYRVGIYTFHGFCNAMIQRFPDDFPRLISSDAITDIDKVLLVRDIIAERDTLAHLRPFYDNFAYVKDIIGAMSTLKREYVHPDTFQQRIRDEEAAFTARDDLYHEKGAHKGKMKTEHQRTLKFIERNKELADIYEQYEAALRERKLYDYEDMIGVVVQRLEEDADVLHRLQEEYHYILADEHQDANTAQNRLLELLVDYHDDPNLFIVGDEKQAIFRFQGASLDNFLYFKGKYPSAKVVELTRSYRSGQPILDAAHGVITTDTPEEVARVPLTSHAAITHAQVQVRSFTADEMELHWVAQDIAERITDGVAADEIAVLYRTNGDAAAVVRALERLRIPHTVESDRNVLDDPAIAQFVMLLRAVADYGNDELLARVLHARFLNLDPLDVYKVIKMSARERIPLHDCIRSEKRMAESGVSDPKALAVFARRLTQWAQAGENDPVPDVFNRVLEASGFLTFALNATRSVEMLEKVSGLARDTEQLASGNRTYSLRDLIHHFDLLDEYRLSITKQNRTDTKAHGVRLMTAHRSKGLEFDYVYIVGAWDTHWGNRRRSDTFALPLAGGDEEENADERRLFYVALTRARIGVSLSYGRVAASGRERLPCQFIEEMHGAHKEVIDMSSFEASIDPDALLRAPQQGTAPSVADREYISELFADQGLSVTALNNYLTCPWQYFYSNLIRIPKIPTKYMVLGTAVHVALKRFFDALRDTTADEAILLEAFDTALTHTSLSGAVYDQVHDRGREALAGWFKTYAGTWHTDTRNEYRVDTSITLNSTEVPQLRVRGDLDKLEVHSDGVVVVDYKTGAPKTRNHMLGKTKAVDAGDYFRQLVFYKMLLDAEGVYHMREGVIDFVQPKTVGTREVYVKESFRISTDDVAQLIDDITRVAQEISTLAFWDERCDRHKKGECEYCALRDTMH